MPRVKRLVTGRHRPGKKQLNVALVGYGFAGQTFHAPLIAATRGLLLRYIASNDPAKVKRAWPEVEVLGYEEVFTRDEVDLVVIATPNVTHFDLAQKALNSGKHVVVDKPFTTTVKEAEKLIALAKKQKRLQSVFQSRRWDSDFLTLRTLLAAGKLGDVMYFESRYDRFRPEVKKRWRELPGPASGTWYDLGSHLADQALQLFGAPDSVYADLATQRAGAKTVDYFHVLLRYGNRRVVLHGGSLVVANTPRFSVHGIHGSYVKHGMDTQEASLKAGKNPGSQGWGQDPLEGVLFIEHEGTMRSSSVPNVPGNYLGYYEALRDAILGKAPNPVSAEEGLQVMKVLELAVGSAKIGREMNFQGRI
ncbi:MAG TPA: oxidoreductase [Terriglobales bacterium]|nr:oxidoreductase [Terriglobales bacterium]